MDKRQPEHCGDGIAGDRLDRSTVPVGGTLERLERGAGHPPQGLRVEGRTSCGNDGKPHEDCRHRLSDVANDRVVDWKRSSCRARLAVRLVGHGQIKRRILVEDRLVQLPQRPGWLDAKLLDQDRPRLLVGIESLGLTAGAIEREQ